jgi:predicted permease
MILHLFHALIAVHIAFGAVGLVSFWVPVVGKKGGKNHRKWGKVFWFTIMVAGSVAIGLSSLTLYDPIATHPHLSDRGAPFVRGIFGVMMLYLAILTLNLAWYGLETIKNKANHMRNRSGVNLWLQPLLILAAIGCAVEGVFIEQYLMVGMSMIGFATAGTNLFFYVHQVTRPERVFERTRESHRGVWHLGLYRLFCLWRSADYA